MKTLGMCLLLAAVMAMGAASIVVKPATAHAVHCTTTCTGNTCYTNCY